jgi:hypothetical protein
MLRNILLSAAALGTFASIKPIYNALNKPVEKTETFGWGNGYY